jgi:alpha-glucosidase
VSVQDGDPLSMLGFYRRMLAWRKRHPALAKGGFAIQETSDSLISYLRTEGEEVLFCAFNLGAEPVVAALPPGDWAIIELPDFVAELGEGGIELPPYQAVFARRA